MKVMEEYSEEEESFVEDEDGDHRGHLFIEVWTIRQRVLNLLIRIENLRRLWKNLKMNILDRITCLNFLILKLEKTLNLNAFSSASNKSKLFKNSLLRFPSDLDNQIFYAVVCGIMYNKINRQQIFLEDAEKTLGTDLFFELKKVEKSTMLGHWIFGFFNCCQSINNVLNDFGYFLTFYERRNKFRYQLRQKRKEKNQMKRELSACVIQKLNGYELIRNSLNSKNRKDFVPIDIVYKPTLK